MQVHPVDVHGTDGQEAAVRAVAVVDGHGHWEADMVRVVLQHHLDNLSFVDEAASHEEVDRFVAALLMDRSDRVRAGHHNADRKARVDVAVDRGQDVHEDDLDMDGWLRAVEDDQDVLAEVSIDRLDERRVACDRRVGDTHGAEMHRLRHAASRPLARYPYGE